ncbi:MAG: hypothetical protein GF329_10280 [Candidatus Lokiarchaeota archaeon]|nr:hypothetical protein [Candidatus Lokiarchaeota archaeon]
MIKENFIAFLLRLFLIFFFLPIVLFSFTFSFEFEKSLRLALEKRELNEVMRLLAWKGFVAIFSIARSTE